MFTTIFTVLWQFRQPILIGAAVIAVLGSLWGYGHSRYNAGRAEGDRMVAEMKATLKKERGEWEKQVIAWNKQVEVQTMEIQRIKKEKDAIAKKNLNAYLAQKKANEKLQEQYEAELAKNIERDAVVVMPSVFRRVYDNAVSRSDVTAPDGGAKASADRPAPSGATETFDALALTKVLVANVEEYNRLALRCDKLITTVKEMEEISHDDTHGGGTDGTVGEDGRNFSGGASRDLLAGYSRPFWRSD